MKAYYKVKYNICEWTASTKNLKLKSLREHFGENEAISKQLEQRHVKNNTKASNVVSQASVI